MDYIAILKQMRQERDQLDEAIATLTRLTLGTKRRGRPPKALAHLGAAAPVKYKRSAETRARMARAQRARWAKEKR